jgi:RNA polymerase sigma-70 factor, ECF subfamily
LHLSTVMTKHDQLHEEASIVSAVCKGDNAAFNVLAERYQRRILKLVRRMTGSFHDAEDVTQEAFIKAFVNIGTFRGTSSFSTWLTRIAINEAHMWRRRPVRRAEVGWPSSQNPDEPGFVPEFVGKMPDPEECYRVQEQGHIFVTASRCVKPEMRQAVEFCDLNDGSMRELALLQGTSLSAAKTRLFRGRKQIRARLRYLLSRKASVNVET